MGLKEKRSIHQFKEEVYPGLKEQIISVVGTPVEINVDWDALAIDKKEHLYRECIPKVFFEPLLVALRRVCADELGKNALAAALKRVLIKNSNQLYSPKGFVFQGGELVLDHSPVSNVLPRDIEARAAKIEEILSDAL